MQKPQTPTPSKGGSTAMVAVRELKPASLAPADLGFNVRRASDEDGMDLLKASIAAHGVLMPLLVRSHKGVRYVIAGNRRLRACIELYGPDYMVPTMNADNHAGDVRQIAMATNVALPPHPIDRYEVMAELAAGGMKPDDMMAHFAIDRRAFNQVMKLAELSQVVRDAWRAGEIEADVAYAFTLLPEKVQEKVYADDKKSGFGLQAHSVRARAVKDQHDVGRIVQFVGLEAARAAGVTVSEDLFGRNHTVDPKHVKILHKLQHDKLQAVADDLTGKEGWAWAVTERPNDSYSYGSITPEKKVKPTKDQEAMLKEIDHLMSGMDDDDDRFGDLENEREIIQRSIDMSGYTPEQRKKSGCFVTVSHDGLLKIEHGRVRPEERRKVDSSERKAAAKSADKPARKDGEVVLTQALAQRLSETMQRSAANVLKTDHRLAMAALIAGFASAGSTVDVRIGGDVGKESKDFASVLEATRGQSVEQLMVMLAQAAAQAVSMTCFSAESMPLRQKGASALLHAFRDGVLEANLVETFDLHGYLSSIPLDAIAAAVGEVRGQGESEACGKMKKGAAVDFAYEQISNTGWLPLELRLKDYGGPVKAGAARPAAKKPPAKKTVEKAAKKSAKKGKK